MNAQSEKYSVELLDFEAKLDGPAFEKIIAAICYKV